MTAYRFFSIKKCSSYNINLITLLKQHNIAPHTRPLGFGKFGGH